MKETHKRSIAKALSWRVIASSTTMLIIFVLTGSMVVSFGAGVFEVLTKMCFYYFHERAWNKVRYGRKKQIKNKTI